MMHFILFTRLLSPPLPQCSASSLFLRALINAFIIANKIVGPNLHRVCYCNGTEWCRCVREFSLRWKISQCFVAHFFGVRRNKCIELGRYHAVNSKDIQNTMEKKFTFAEYFIVKNANLKFREKACIK